MKLHSIALLSLLGSVPTFSQLRHGKPHRNALESGRTINGEVRALSLLGGPHLPSPGISEELKTRIQTSGSVVAVFQTLFIPDQTQWNEAGKLGATRLGFITDRNWFVRIKFDRNDDPIRLLGEISHVLGATAVFDLPAKSKMAPVLWSGKYRPGTVLEDTDDETGDAAVPNVVLTVVTESGTALEDTDDDQTGDTPLPTVGVIVTDTDSDTVGDTALPSVGVTLNTEVENVYGYESYGDTPLPSRWGAGNSWLAGDKARSSAQFTFPGTSTGTKHTVPSQHVIPDVDADLDSGEVKLGDISVSVQGGQESHGHAVNTHGADSATAILANFGVSSDEEEQQDPLAVLYDRDTDFVQVEVTFFKGSSNMREALGHTQIVAQPDKLTFVVKVLSSDLKSLAHLADVQFVAPYFEPAPLMADTREKVGIDGTMINKHGIDVTGVPAAYAPGGWTGEKVRVSTFGEGFDQDHDDFWNHDADGDRTTERWDCAHEYNYGHGTMTGGILMGNGWNSESHGGTPYGFRGIAPEATFECHYEDPDILSRSFTGNPLYIPGTDIAIHDPAHTQHHVYVSAAGNEGLVSQWSEQTGYYSILNVQKNEIIVQNMAANDLRWGGGSCGPTWDGRMKPDIAAPGSANKWPTDITTVGIDLQLISFNHNSGTETFTFGSPVPGFEQGWGSFGWFTRAYMTDAELRTEGSVAYRHWDIYRPWRGQGGNRPSFGTITMDDETTPLSISGGSSDAFTIKYRISEPHFDGTVAAIVACSEDFRDYATRNCFVAGTFTLIADGEWNTALIHVGANPQWAGLVETIGLIVVQLQGRDEPTPFYDCDGCYGGASGTSAAAPVVAGAAALLTQQFHELYGVSLVRFDNQLIPSPFRQDVPPSNGVVMPSTFRAIIAHTALDLAAVHIAGEIPNPDTLEATIYHKGPDYVTGHGLLQAGAALDLVQADHDMRAEFPTNPYHFIVEDTIDDGAKIYELNVEEQERHLVVTLAWDDPPSSASAPPIESKIVNRLDLLLLSPSGHYHFPWSLDLPFIPTEALEPSPQPITNADIHPARRDMANIRDNLKKVEVEFPESGAWQVHVTGASIAEGPQRLSLILGTPTETSNRLNGGLVSFISDREGTPQLFIKNVAPGSGPPTKISDATNERFIRYPIWSFNGEFFALVEREPTDGTDTLVIIDFAGNEHARFPALATFGTKFIKYPSWSRQGDKISVMNFNSWGSRGLQILSFSSPYNFASGAASALIGLDGPDPGSSVFSKDGHHIFYSASSNSYLGAIFQVRLDGTGMKRVMGNGGYFDRAFDLSLDPTGRFILFNSEQWTVDPETYLDEELVKLDTMGGVLFQETKQPGHQYGDFAIHGQGEYVMKSQDTVGGNTDLFLVHGDVRTPLDTDDPDNISKESSSNWYRHGPDGPSWFRFRHISTNIGLYNLAGDVHGWPYWESPGMAYVIDKLDSDWVHLRHMKTLNCIAVVGESVHSMPCNSADNGQSFTLEDDGGGTRLKSMSGKCLHVLDDIPGPWASVIAIDCSGSPPGVLFELRPVY